MSTWEVRAAGGGGGGVELSLYKHGASSPGLYLHVSFFTSSFFTESALSPGPPNPLVKIHNLFFSLILNDQYVISQMTYTECILSTKLYTYISHEKPSRGGGGVFE